MDSANDLENIKLLPNCVTICLIIPQFGGRTTPFKWPVLSRLNALVFQTETRPARICKTVDLPAVVQTGLITSVGFVGTVVRCRDAHISEWEEDVLAVVDTALKMNATFVSVTTVDRKRDFITLDIQVVKKWFPTQNMGVVTVNDHMPSSYRQPRKWMANRTPAAFGQVLFEELSRKSDGGCFWRRRGWTMSR